MSTRCQVQVIQESVERVPWEQKVTLYHHSDGYPEGMLPLFQEAHNKAIEYLQKRQDEMTARYPSLPRDKLNTWELGRAGKAASFLCYAQPAQFEPEEGHDLHADIEYYYKLYVSGAVWEVEVFDMPDNILLQQRLEIHRANDQWATAHTNQPD